MWLVVLVLVLQGLTLLYVRGIMGNTQQGLTDLQNALSALAALQVAITNGFAQLNAQIAALQAQPTEVTDAQLDAMAATVSSFEAAVTAVLPPAPPAPAPSAKTAS